MTDKAPAQKPSPSPNRLWLRLELETDENIESSEINIHLPDIKLDVDAIEQRLAPFVRDLAISATRKRDADTIDSAALNAYRRHVESLLAMFIRDYASTTYRGDGGEWYEINSQQPALLQAGLFLQANCGWEHDERPVQHGIYHYFRPKMTEPAA